MSGTTRHPVTLSTLLGLTILFSLPLSTTAADHVVSAAELHRSVARSSAARQENVAKVQTFFKQERIQVALKAAKVDERKIESAVPTLSNAEVARLARATDQAQKDFAAGSLTNEQLTYIVIALATAVIVILIAER